MQSIFWHDYETFGANPQKDRPCQFAGVRTDLDLNIIEEPVTFYCKPSEDFLPSPEACLITGITPQVAMREGEVEALFAEKINHIFSVPGTCVAGYNSIRFDDEVSRNLFYRNFIDPYEREWKSGNSRWDIIDVVRLVYVMKPDTLNWPLNDDGSVSFRLELLTKENGIEHLSAHDAMSDVYATIELARLVKQRQPKLFDWVFMMRDKNKINDMFDFDTHKPLLHVSSKYRASSGCCALVAPLFRHPSNKNGVVVWDLRQDLSLWQGESVEEIRDRLYMSGDELGEQGVRPGLKTVHINKCPIVLPASSIQSIAAERLNAWGLDMGSVTDNLAYLRSNPDLVSRLAQVFIDESRPVVNDPDLMIYSGGFFSASDKAVMSRVRNAGLQELSEGEFLFSDGRLAEMLFRYKARSYPQSLTPEEQERWQQHCYERIISTDSVYMNIEQYAESLRQLSASASLTAGQQFILEELQCYAESIIPYV
jgi:exodeoxyribonuclease-1